MITDCRKRSNVGFNRISSNVTVPVHAFNQQLASFLLEGDK